nr:serine/arginine repetitive matrix protein 2-like [Ipomoea trifida]
MLREKVRKHEAALRSWEQYPGSAQFHKDAVAYFANRPAVLPDLAASACQSEEAALPLFQTLQRDPVGLKMLRREVAWGYSRGKEAMQVLLHRALEEAVQPETWEELRAMLPEDVAPPGPEPFTDPATNPSTTASKNQDPK